MIYDDYRKRHIAVFSLLISDILTYKALDFLKFLPKIHFQFTQVIQKIYKKPK